MEAERASQEHEQTDERPVAEDVKRTVDGSRNQHRYRPRGAGAARSHKESAVGKGVESEGIQRAASARYYARGRELLETAVREQQRASTAVVVTPALDANSNPVTLIAATVPIHSSHLRTGEVLVPFDQDHKGSHGEIRTMRFAATRGYRLLPGSLHPTLEKSNAFCPNCAFHAQQARSGAARRDGITRGLEGLASLSRAVKEPRNLEAWCRFQTA